MRWVVFEKDDPEANENESGEVTLIPVLFGDRGEATIGAGIVCRFVNDGAVLSAFPSEGAYPEYDERDGKVALSWLAGDDGAVDCVSSVLKLLLDGLD